MVKDWQKSLEMQLPDLEPEAAEKRAADLVEFNQLKQKELKDIEHFVQIVNDWVHEKSTELESVPATKTSGGNLAVPNDDVIKPATRQRSS